MLENYIIVCKLQMFENYKTICKKEIVVDTQSRMGTNFLSSFSKWDRLFTFTRNPLI